MATPALTRPAEPPPALRLYDLADEYRAALDLSYDEHGELCPILEALLAEISDAPDRKVERCILLARELRASAAVAKGEAARLAARARVDENAAERYEDYALSLMMFAGCKTVKTERVRVTVAPSPPKVDWLGDPADLPAEFRRQIPASYALDKTALVAWYKAHDESLPDDPRFAVTRGQHLVVK